MATGGVRARAGTRLMAGFAVAVCVAGLAGVPASAAAAETAAPTADQATLKPVAVVVLADESGSLSPDDVAAEREAASTIAQTVLAADSRVSIVGFGSDNGGGQEPVQTYCSQVVLDSQQNRDRLAGCIDRIHERTEAEGNDTDQVSALQQAKSLLDDGTVDPKIVFLLTDGKLQVGRSGKYGKDSTPDKRQRTAEGLIPGVRGELAKLKAQVWPLGYGQVPPGALDAYTTGTSCSPQEPAPAASVISGQAELVAAVKGAFESATCVKFGDDAIGVTPQGGGQLALDVDLPPIASDAAILVFKRDPGFTVSYQGPSKQQVTGDTGPDGEHFDFVGQQTSTESLHIVEPQPGRWTVVVSSKPGSPSKEVRAIVAYQAAVNAAIALDPPQPKPGQAVEVAMSVQARGKTITSPADLKPLTFVADLAGDGFTAPAPVTLSDADGDGTYRGTLTVPPSATGKLVFTGRVSGLGIGGDTRVANTGVQEGVPTLLGQITVNPAGATVTVGDTVSGQVAVTNSGTAPARLRLEADDATAGLGLSVSDLSVPPGPQSLTPFQLRVAPEAPIGGAQATLRLVDAASGKVVAERLFTTEITPVPSLFERLFWLWIALLALVLLTVAAVLVLLGRRRKARAVGGLRAQLYRDGFAQDSFLEPRNRLADRFRFVVQDDFHGVTLQHAGPADPDAWVVSRAKGLISFTRPGDPRDPIVRAGEQRDIGGGLAVAILDERGGSIGPAPAADNPFSGGGDPLAGGGSFGAPVYAESGSSGTNGRPVGRDGERFDAPTVAETVPQPRPSENEFDSSYADPFAQPGASGPGGGQGSAPPPRGYDHNNPF
jgi:von Willebrand factor type A domain